MEQHFKEILAYSSHCNDEIIMLLIQYEKYLPKYVVELVCHILNRHHILNNQILSRKPEYGLWEIHNSTLWMDINQRNNEITSYIIQTHDIQDLINYKTTTGIPYTNKLKDLLYHIFNHSTHHRAQIGIHLRKLDIATPKNDFLFYKQQLNKKT